jgi:hypothetical protein
MKISLLSVGVAALLAAATSAPAAVITLNLDFGTLTTPLTPGYTLVEGNFLANTPTASVLNIASSGYNFSINNVGVYSAGDAANPLTTDGFYTFQNDALDHTFTISGLAPGDQVAVYAVAGWDGNGRGAQIVYGAGMVQAQTIGTPGLAPTLANFTFIGTDVANGSGVVTGAFHGAGFPGTLDSEGQVGGLIIQVTTVPEPGTGVLLIGSMGGILLFRRRRTL